MKRLAEVLTRLRLDISIKRTRYVVTTTEELWMELAERFPVQALVIDPLARWPSRWLWFNREGHVMAIVIGGV